MKENAPRTLEMPTAFLESIHTPPGLSPCGPIAFRPTFQASINITQAIFLALYIIVLNPHGQAFYNRL